MFSLLRAAMTLLICVLIVGFYLGWFTFSRPTPDPRSNKVNINVSVDKSKVRSDLQSAEQTLAKRLQERQQPAPGQWHARALKPADGHAAVEYRPDFDPAVRAGVVHAGRSAGKPTADAIADAGLPVQHGADHVAAAGRGTVTTKTAILFLNAFATSRLCEKN